MMKCYTLSASCIVVILFLELSNLHNDKLTLSNELI